MKSADPISVKPQGVADKDEEAVLRIAREPLRSEPPVVRFVPRDSRLPQL
jgi:hypothetical protein